MDSTLTMTALPSDMYCHIARYMSTTDAFVLAQVCHRWHDELKTFPWLWRKMRIDCGVQLHWSFHQYNTRQKRKRQEEVNMSPLLTLKGAFLHKLVLGSVTEPLLNKFTVLHLAALAQHCPELQRLDIYVSKLQLTQHSLDVFMQACPKLRYLTLPVGAFFLPGEMTREKDSIRCLQLYGDWATLQPVRAACFGRITTLKLVDVHNVEDLSVLLACTSLKHLMLQNCTSRGDHAHPHHFMDDGGALMQRFFTTLLSLHLVRCETVVCTAFILQTLYHNLWQKLTTFGMDDAVLSDAIEHNSWFQGLTCDKCVEARVVKRGFFYAVQCSRCDACRVRAPSVQSVFVY